MRTRGGSVWRVFNTLLASLMMLLWAHQAMAYTFFDDSLEVKGFVRNITSFRVDNPEPGMGGGLYDKGDVELMRTFLQIEASYKFSPDIKFYGRWRGSYDSVFDIKGHDNFMDKVVDDQWFQSDLREAYVDYRSGPLFLRLGKQQVVWGESDGLRLADIINPLDMSWHYILENWEDIRIGLWMVRGIYSLTSKTDLELVWVPAKFEPTKFAGQNMFWEIPGLGEGGIPERRYHTSLDNGSIGGKIRTILPYEIEVSVYDYYHRYESPSITLTPTGLLVEHPYVNSVGGTFNVNVEPLKAILRGESVFTVNEPQFDVAQPDFVSKNNTFAWMLGIDRPTNLPINSESSLLSFQVFWKKILNTDPTTVTFGGPGDTFMTVFTGLISTSYPRLIPNCTLTPQVFAAFDVDGSGWVQPKVSLKYGDNWTFALGSNVFWGQPISRGFFNPVSDRSEVFVEIKRSFQ